MQLVCTEDGLNFRYIIRLRLHSNFDTNFAFVLLLRSQRRNCPFHKVGPMSIAAMKKVEYQTKNPNSTWFSLLSERVSRKLFEQSNISIVHMKSVLDTVKLSRDIETVQKGDSECYSHELHIMELVTAQSVHELFKAIENIWASSIMSTQADGGENLTSTELCRRQLGKTLCYICLSRGGLRIDEIWEILGCNNNGSVPDKSKAAIAQILEVSLKAICALAHFRTVTFPF
jgi:hypothetical protein